jgi:hypothetical protein
VNREDAAATIREGAMTLGGFDKGELARRLQHVADAVQNNEIGDPTLWDNQ